MFEPFSSGYYLGRLYVTRTSGGAALLQREQHETANREIYATGEGVERLDNPLVMKLEERHFPVHAAEDVPEGTLAVPEDLLESTRIDNPPALKEVLVAKKEHAKRLHEYGAV
ncbi:MAG: DUF5802 family protein [Halodesulfurarchaeum sp.]